jgi:hypothetical protein
MIMPDRAGQSHPHALGSDATPTNARRALSPQTGREAKP